jgi:hypothetical protein
MLDNGKWLRYIQDRSTCARKGAIVRTHIFLTVIFDGALNFILLQDIVKADINS